MIEPSREFELHHPWLAVLLYICTVLLIAVALGLPAWGWVEVRFSAIQRHYLYAYMESSVARLAGDGAGEGTAYVDWIEKRAPGREWTVAAPEDLVPAEGGRVPFALSPAARAQGWSELGSPWRGASKEREIRKFLREEFFSGRSFWMLLLEPFEIPLLGFLSWKVFAVWREDLARERGASWDPYYRPTSWQEDLPLFGKALAGEAKMIAAWCWRWTGKPVGKWAGQWIRRRSMARRRSRVEAARAVPSEPAPPPVPAIEVVSVRSPEPAVPAASMPQPAPKPAPRSPFGRPPADGEPVRKWDISQWIN